MAFGRTELLFQSDINEQGYADANGSFSDLYVKHWVSGEVELISADPTGAQSDGYMSMASFSSDGRFVVFSSSASNLTDDNPAHFYNLFLRDRTLGTTRRLTFPPGGGEFASSPYFTSRPVITSDNRQVVFSAAGVPFTEEDVPPYGGIYEIELASGAIRSIPRTTSGELPNAPVGRPALSADGRFLAFLSSATNLTAEPGPVPAVFVQDRRTGETISVSAPLGTPPDPFAPAIAISADGSTVAFEWPQWNATWPTLLDSQQVYTVRLWETAPVVAPTAVPLGTAPALLLLAAGLAGVAWSTSRRRPGIAALRVRRGVPREMARRQAARR